MIERLTAQGKEPKKLANVIAELHKEDSRFQVEGGSWTNNISWVKSYDALLGSMERSSSLFYEKALKPGVAIKGSTRNQLLTAN
jgi:hypothetical protein